MPPPPRPTSAPRSPDRPLYSRTACRLMRAGCYRASRFNAGKPAPLGLERCHLDLQTWSCLGAPGSNPAVIPAQAGIQSGVYTAHRPCRAFWIPASAGMTDNFFSDQGKTALVPRHPGKSLPKGRHGAPTRTLRPPCDRAMQLNPSASSRQKKAASRAWDAALAPGLRLKSRFRDSGCRAGQVSRPISRTAGACWPNRAWSRPAPAALLPPPPGQGARAVP